MQLVGRTTCLRCELDDKTTDLVFTSRGGICPVHSAAFLQSIYDHAKTVLGIPLEVSDKGRPEIRMETE